MTDFINDNVCPDWLKNNQYPNGIFCDFCQKITPHYSIKSHRFYLCQDCGHRVHPRANTIFYKSTTLLTTWFYVIYLMDQTRGCISAKQIQRETGVTHKTAWRM